MKKKQKDSYMIDKNNPRSPDCLLTVSRAAISINFDDDATEFTDEDMLYLTMGKVLAEKAAICGHPEAPFFISFLYDGNGFENLDLALIWLAIGVEIEKYCDVVGEEIHRLQPNQVTNNRATQVYQQKLEEENLVISEKIWEDARAYVEWMQSSGERHPLNELVSLQEISEECVGFLGVCDRYDGILSQDLIDNPAAGEEGITTSGRCEIL